MPEYDTYEIRLEAGGSTHIYQLEIDRDFRHNDQAIWNSIMDDLMVEWDRIN